MATLTEIAAQAVYAAALADALDAIRGEKFTPAERQTAAQLAASNTVETIIQGAADTAAGDAVDEW